MLPLGFKGTGMFDDSKWYQRYKLEIPKKRRVYIVDIFDDSVCHFNLTLKQYRAFKANELGLVPLGCCGGFSGECLEHPTIDFQGNFDEVFGNKKNLLAYLEKLIKKD